MSLMAIHEANARMHKEIKAYKAEIDALKSECDALLTDLRTTTEVGDRATPDDVVGVVRAMWEELRWLLKQADALKAQNAELLAAQEGTPCKHEFNAVLGGVLSCTHCYASFSEQKEAIAKARGESCNTF